MIAIPLAVVMLTPVVFSSQLATGILAAKYFWLYFFTLPLIPLLIYLAIARSITFNSTDYLVILFAAYLFLQHFHLEQSSQINRKMIWTLDGVIVYLYIRHACQYRIPGIILFACVIITATAGLLQQAGIYASFNPAYPVTGTFFHPAVLAGFVATIFPLSYIYTLRAHERSIQYLAGITCVMALLILAFADSRAAFLALIAGTIYAISDKMRLQGWLARRRKWVIITGVCLILILVPCLYFLYQVRPASVQGRWLVWKISVEMLKSSPFTGHGIDAFRSSYPLYQQAFFRSGEATAHERFLSDEVTGAFNEPLQLACELGLLGLLIMLMMVISVCRRSEGGITEKGAKAGLVTFGIFSFFSYPFSLPELTLVFFILLALSNAQVADKAKKTRPYFLWIILLSAGVAWQAPMLFRQLNAYQQWSIAGHAPDPERSCSIYARMFNTMEHNDLFLSAYAANLYALKAYDESIHVLRLQKGKTYRDLMLLADNYKAIGDNNSAITYYEDAHYLLPHRFQPLYAVMMLTADQVKAKQLARMITDMPVKIQAPEVDTIKAQALVILSR
jgi:O-antigen ligase